MNPDYQISKRLANFQTLVDTNASEPFMKEGGTHLCFKEPEISSYGIWNMTPELAGMGCIGVWPVD